MASGAGPERSPDVTWSEPAIDRSERWQALEQTGATVWLTGLPAAGKSSIGSALEQRLVGLGRAAYRLDGDNLRHGLNGDLAFSPEDRAENVRRTAHVARLFADSGTVAIVGLVSPFARDRQTARELHEQDGLRFVEVFVDTTLEECERRDPDGLYARARRGELSGLTGVDGPYEAPEQPELTIASGTPVDAAVDAVVHELTRHGIL